MKTTICVALFALLSICSLSAQKYGHVNLGNLLQGMSEVKTGDQELNRYRDGLIDKGEQMAKKLDAEIKKYQIDVEAKLLSPVQKREREKVLQKLQQELGVYEQELVDKVAAKREEIFQPILMKVDNAVNEVGKEGGFTMIFDEGMMNGVLYSEQSLDVTELVKEKL